MAFGRVCHAEYRQSLDTIGCGRSSADTEAKWPRINQRRPIINELRPGRRVCIKTRVFVTRFLEGAAQSTRNYLGRQTLGIRTR